MSSYANPFDFEKPVRNPKLFAGRREILDEIDYYLGLSASENPTYHNLSLIGQRAAGKSSLLNMIQYMAEKRGYLALKIALNNETSSNEVLLFKEIIDGLMTAGAEKEMFGGIGNEVYRKFRKVIDLLDTQIEIPLLIGTAYVGAKTKNITSITQHVLTHDLSKINEEAKKHGIPAIVILLDECDLLASNETLLQKIRNVFSELDGFILVFSGTERMFPAMQETFSPVPRLFKRINVENFKSPEETKECIINRLPENERPLINDGTIYEIHNISNGSPYEVQLISHFMYKQFKDSKSPRIVMNTAVLDRVINELDRLRAGGHHEIANRIKHLNPFQLKVLKGAIEFPNVTKDDLATSIVLSEIDSIDVKALSNQIDYYALLIESLTGVVLKNENGKLRVDGDQFDLLYLRYYLIANGITEFTFGNPEEPDINIARISTNTVLRGIPAYQENIRFDKTWSGREIAGRKTHKVVYGGRFKPKPDAKPGELVTLMSFSPAEIDQKFYLGTPNSIRFRVNVDFLDAGFVIQYIFDTDDDLRKATANIESLTTRLDLLGLKIVRRDEVQCTNEGIDFANVGNYTEAYGCYEEALKLNPEYELAWANKGIAQFREGKYEEALTSFRRWADIRPALGQPLEEQGKCFIHMRKYQEAMDLLDKAVKREPERWSAWDNRGRTLLHLGRNEEAIESFDKAISLNPDDNDAGALKAACLMRLGKEKEALRLLDEILSKQPNHIEALYHKASLLHRKGDWEEALRLIEHADPEEKIALCQDVKIVSLNKMGRHSEAIACCDRVLEKHPTWANALYNRACSKVLMGKIDDGLEDLRKVFVLNKNYYLTIAANEPDFESIKNDDRFKALVTKDNQ